MFEHLMSLKENVYFKSLLQPESLRIVFIALITLLFWKKWLCNKSKLPPGPQGVPFLGVLPFLTNRPDKKIKVCLS